MTNLWRGLAFLWLGGVASPLLTTGAGADPLDAGDPARRPPGVERPAVPAASANRIELVAPSEIVGRKLRDPQNAPAGLVRNVVIDARTGAVMFVLVGSGGAGFDLGDSLVAVPWSAFRVPSDARQPIGVSAPAARIAAAPRLARGDVSERLPAPTAARALEWFGAAPPQEAQSDLVPVTRMLGALVYAKDSSEMIGGISQIMLDLAHGHVGYCIMSRDQGFRVWTPVPFGALAWAPDLGDFSYLPDPETLDRAPALTMEPTTTATSEAELGALYSRFGVKPYWTLNG